MTITSFDPSSLPPPASVQQLHGVQIVGLKIGRGDKSHAVLKQGIEQAMQDHGVCDVGHMKFVKSNEFVFFGNLLAQHIQRIDRALQLAQLAVHLAHEFMKMQTGFALDRYSLKKAIHQKALAPPHAAKHIHATRNGRTVDEFLIELERFSLYCAHSLAQRSSASMARSCAGSL